MSDTTAAAPAAESAPAATEQTTAELALNKTDEKKPRTGAQKDADTTNGLREWLKAKKARSDEPTEPKSDEKTAQTAAKAKPEADKPTTAKAEKLADQIEELGGEAPEQKKDESNKDYELRLSKMQRKLRDAEAETVKARKEAQAARDEATKFDAEVKKFTKLMEDGKANPLRILKHLGVSYEELTKGIINDKYKVENEPQLPPEVQERIERLEKLEKDREADRVRREAEARQSEAVKSVTKYIDDNADDFPLAAGWGPAAAKLVAQAYAQDRAPSRADLEELEETLAKEAMGLVGKARGAKALLKRNPELKAALMEALGVSDRPAETPAPAKPAASKSIANTPTEATARKRSRDEENRILAAELAELRRRRNEDD